MYIWTKSIKLFLWYCIKILYDIVISLFEVKDTWDTESLIDTYVKRYTYFSDILQLLQSYWIQMNTRVFKSSLKPSIFCSRGLPM